MVIFQSIHPLLHSRGNTKLWVQYGIQFFLAQFFFFVVFIGGGMIQGKACMNIDILHAVRAHVIICTWYIKCCISVQVLRLLVCNCASVF